MINSYFVTVNSLGTHDITAFSPYFPVYLKSESWEITLATLLYNEIPLDLQMQLKSDKLNIYIGSKEKNTGKKINYHQFKKENAVCSPFMPFLRQKNIQEVRSLWQKVIYGGVR